VEIFELAAKRAPALLEATGAMPAIKPVVTAAPAANPETFLDQPEFFLAARRAARFMTSSFPL
jgi:hypothetical protein